MRFPSNTVTQISQKTIARAKYQKKKASVNIKRNPNNTATEKKRASSPLSSLKESQRLFLSIIQIEKK